MYIHMYMYINSSSLWKAHSFDPTKSSQDFYPYGFAGELLLDPVDISVSEFDTGKVREAENASQS